jgi:outer membrane receptor protein involved in Fe transport
MYEPDNRLITYFSSKMTDSTYFPYQLEYSSNANSDANARLFSDVRENNYSINVNYQHGFQFGNFRPELRVGAFGEEKKRNFYIRPFGIVWANPTAINNPEILYQPIDSVYDPANFNFTNGIVFKEIFDDSYRYEVSNVLLAGYLSVKLPVTRFLSIYGGLRLEKNTMDLSGPNAMGEYISKVSRDTLNLFPSVNVTFNLNDKNLIRIAYGRTVNRPEFREIAPFSFYNFQENVVVYGNDSLQSCYIDNFDLRYEWYPTPGEMVTIGAFYKSFDHPIEATWIPSSSGEWDLTYLNAIRAYSIGAEIDVRKSFQSFGKRSDFLRNFRNLSLVMNASVIYCRVETDLDFVLDNNRPMYGQSPFIVNAGVYYQADKPGISLSLLYNVFGKRIVGIGTPEIPNSYEMPRHVVDFTFQKKFEKGVALKFGIKDLLNQEISVQQVMKTEGLPDAIVKVKAYRPGRSVALGVSYTF